VYCAENFYLLVEGFAVRVTFNNHLFSAYSKDTLCIGVARLGSDDQKIVAGPMEKLLDVDFGAPLHCLIIVGETHPVEEEMIKFYMIE
jgi:diphthine methyl ester synthase